MKVDSPLNIFFFYGVLFIMFVVACALFLADQDLLFVPIASQPFPFRTLLEAKLRNEIVQFNYSFPSPELWERIVNIGQELFDLPRVRPHQLDGPDPIEPPSEVESRRQWKEAWAKADTHALDAITTSLMAFIMRLPPPVQSTFQRPLLETTNPASLIWDMIQPLREPLVADLNLFKSVVDTYAKNAGVQGAHPQDYTGPKEELAVAYFRNIPMLPLLQTSVPFVPFTEQERFTHHWIMGHNGTGKTTYLSRLLKADLASVGRDECSLVVVDSKKLIRDMRDLVDFGPYNELDGRLTLVDADDLFPLNPFLSGNPKGIVSYMLANLTEASNLQAGAINFYINAVMASPEKNLRTMQKLIAMGKDELPTAIMGRLDPTTNNWFRHTRKTLAGLTSGGVAQRLDNFMDESKLLSRMFEADTFGLDIKGLHEGGRVWLIDTNRAKFGKDGANLLGRMIIALINQLSEYRTNVKGPYKPVWVVIDEAQDYIASDAIFADILEKARSSRIGVTIAHHHLGQIPDTRVKGALENVGIKSQCHDIGSVEVKKRRESFTLRVDRLDFEHEPKMRPEDYTYLREWMRFHFPYRQAPTLSLVDDEPLTHKKT